MKRDLRILIGLGTGCVVLAVVAAVVHAGNSPRRDAGAVMPNLIGMALSDARDQLDDLQLKAHTVDDTGRDRHVLVDSNWIVTSQDPSGGSALGGRKNVTLGVVKNGETPRSSTTVPLSPAANVDRSDPAPSTTPVAPVAPEPHNACLMLDRGVLEAALMSTTLDKPITYIDEGATTYGCENDLSEVMLEIHRRSDAATARRAADFATRDADSDYRHVFPNAVRLPYGDTVGGAKIIATETGISRISWSHGAYWILLEINSDPVIPHVAPRHPFDTLNRLADQIHDNVEQHLTNGNW
ncbi:PASTA domain-containing protein [Nocardia nova]|uniref:PASTA domain-containing protein n=1 Tax=Nocardia nova TaxID=37330 RepID=UPI00340F4480